MDRLPTDDSTAHDVFRDIYPVRPSFLCAKRINDMPDAWVPTLDDQATTISVVRRLPYVSYRCFYLGFMDDDDVEALITPAMDHILTSSPFLESTDRDGPKNSHSTMARSPHGGVNGHLMGWHEAEYSSCATIHRGS